MILAQSLLYMLAEMHTALDTKVQVLTRFVNVNMIVKNLQEKQISAIRIAILT